MDGTTIATLILAIATVWLGYEAKKSAKAAEKSIDQVQEMYEKYNTPLLVFDFNFDDEQLLRPIPPGPNDDESKDRREWTKLVGTLSNVSSTSAIDCGLIIAHIGENGNIDFQTEKPIPMVSGLSPNSHVEINKILTHHDQMNNTGEDMRPVNSYSQYLDCPVPPDKECNYLVVFAFKNRFGKRFYSVYRIINGDGIRYKRRARYFGITEDIKKLEPFTIENAKPDVEM